jgi:hypothetical protein
LLVHHYSASRPVTVLTILSVIDIIGTPIHDLTPDYLGVHVRVY